MRASSPQTPLADVADIFNGKTPSKADQRESGYPVLKIKDVDEGGRFRGRFDSFVDNGYAETFSAKTVKAGDTLILNAAHNADYVGSKKFFASHDVEGALATGEWLIVRPDPEKLDALFAHHWLAADRAGRQIRDLVKGIHLYPKDVARLEIPLPPLDEQRRIAAILDKADALRRKRKRALELLDTLTQSIYLEMFEDEQNVVPLAEVCSRITDGTHQAPNWADQGIPFLFVSNVRNQNITFETKKFVSLEEYGRLTKSAPIEAGDVLYTAVGSYGNAAVVSGVERFVFQRHIAHIKPIVDRIDSTFLSYALESPALKLQADKAARGIAQKTVTLESLKQFLIPLPKRQHQRIFVERVGKMRRLVSVMTTMKLELEDIFASLQHRAFSGQL